MESSIQGHQLKKICKGATVLDSLAIQGSMVYEAKGRVQNWIK